jgi:hypothetical protein
MALALQPSWTIHHAHPASNHLPAHLPHRRIPIEIYMAADKPTAPRILGQDDRRLIKFLQIKEDDDQVAISFFPPLSSTPFCRPSVTPFDNGRKFQPNKRRTNYVRTREHPPSPSAEEKKIISAIFTQKKGLYLSKKKLFKAFDF